ncbi:YitT family protein [Bacillus sp. ISL-37]|uniref:YitT family protein n=1 Tax=Bacillus sp. ISL-37 TaxID=2819123 RepID=UPI00336A8530
MVPHHLLDGGMIGIGLIIHYFYGWPTGLTMIFLSIPLYVLAWILERKYFFHSLHGLLVSSLFIDLFAPVEQGLQLGIFSSAIIGGLLVGCGIGLMLRYETSTGGTDLLAQLIHKFSSLNVGILIFLIDGLVVLSGLKVIGMEKFIYSLLTITCVGLMTSLCVIKREQVL